MKKLMLAIFLIILLYVFIGRVSSLAIPDDALRIIVIANSNSDYYKLLKNKKRIDQARKIINNNLNDIDSNVKETLQLLNYELGYDINFGLNYFPSKEYKGVTYDEGYYESLVITLGEGKGDNWWCVLFPPLCLLEAEESTEVEYTSFVKELLDKYL